jgi:hypothetical protein
MRKKKIAPIDIQTLMRADEFIRRALKEKIFRVKRGRRVAAMALVYNMLAVGGFRDYEDFVQWAMSSADIERAA